MQKHKIKFDKVKILKVFTLCKISQLYLFDKIFYLFKFIASLSNQGFCLTFYNFMPLFRLIEYSFIKKQFWFCCDEYFDKCFDKIIKLLRSQGELHETKQVIVRRWKIWRIHVERLLIPALWLLVALHLRTGIIICLNKWLTSLSSERSFPLYFQKNYCTLKNCAVTSL